MDGFSIDSFRSRIGATFDVAVSGGGRLVTIELTEVSELTSHAFSFLFSGPAEPVLAQATYALTDVDGAATSLFIVPLGPGATAPMVYEAVINNAPTS